jgi:uncharacterized membrane protein
MEINGLPLHPLVVHAAVVFGPIGALAALAYVALPGRRDRLRWAMLVLAVLATLSVVAAYLSGNNFLGSRPDLEQLPTVVTHKARATKLLWATLAFGVVALLAAWLPRRTGALRVALDVLLGVSAVAVLVLVLLTGDSGARSVWG